jgi:hypothetical protein
MRATPTRRAEYIEMIARRGRTAEELAERWDVQLPLALEFLCHFRAEGLAVEASGIWYASSRSLRHHQWLAPIGDETRERRTA